VPGLIGYDPRKMIDTVATALPGKTESQASPDLSPAAKAALSENISPAYSPIVVAGLVRLVEWLVIAATGSAIYAVYVLPRNGFEWIYPAVIVMIATLGIIAFQIADIYQIHAFQHPVERIARLVLAWSAVFLIATSIFFFAKSGPLFSRIWLVAFYAMGLLALFVERGLLRMIVRRWIRHGRLIRRTAIVGCGERCATLIQAIQNNPGSDIHLVGIFDDRADRSPATYGDIEKLGNVDDLVEFARRTRIDLVIVSLPITAEQRILQMLEKLWVLPLDIRLAAHINKLRFRPRSYSYIGGIPVLDIFDRPLMDWDVMMKWLFDKIVGSLVLVAALPLMGAIALAIKLDSRGPVLFRQKRYGFNNDLIEVYKFRSLYTDQCDARAARLVTAGDPRVTRVGRFIRKTSLDELPQLFNVVVKGNLSLVGPRPHALDAKAEARRYDEAVDGYFARHRVKPGVTGWAQINGWRGETDTLEKIQKRVEHDLYYIENWSLLLDIYIVAMTPFALMKTGNVY